MLLRVIFFFISLSSLMILRADFMENEKALSDEMVFVADTQSPMWIEGVFLRQDNNPRATKMVFEDILARQPKVLFLLGDVVSLGRSLRAWASADTFLNRFRQDNIPMFAILGNHELMQRPIKGEYNFQQRFPEHKRTGYVVTIDSVAVVLLNSNFNAMDRTEIELQRDWYRQTMEQLDTDPSVLTVIVGCHHSPFTNSKLVGASVPVQDLFVPPYLKCNKARLFFSGHAHLFEHYIFEGKNFFVIGGGGGLQHPYRKNMLRMPDLAIDYKPLFHYMIVKRDEDKLKLISRRLLPDFSGFADGKLFEIPIQ